MVLTSTLHFCRSQDAVPRIYSTTTVSGLDFYFNPFLGVQWYSAWLETEGPRVRASPVSCPWAILIDPSLVLVQPRKTCPYITERLLMLMGRKESNQTNNPFLVDSSIQFSTVLLWLNPVFNISNVRSRVKSHKFKILGTIGFILNYQ